MTKITRQDLPNKDTPMYYCEICKQHVPWESKHKRKHHGKN